MTAPRMPAVMKILLLYFIAINGAAICHVYHEASLPRYGMLIRRGSAVTTSPSRYADIDCRTAKYTSNAATEPLEMISGGTTPPSFYLYYSFPQCANTS